VCECAQGEMAYTFGEPHVGQGLSLASLSACEVQAGLAQVEVLKWFKITKSISALHRSPPKVLPYACLCVVRRQVWFTEYKPHCSGRHFHNPLGSETYGCFIEIKG